MAPPRRERRDNPYALRDRFPSTWSKEKVLGAGLTNGAPF